MANFMNDLFTTKVPVLRYSWTFTNMAPPKIPRGDPMPSMEFATGVLLLNEMTMASKESPFLGYWRAPRYVDSNVKLWGAEGLHVNPSSIVPPEAPSTWVDQLMILPAGSGCSIMYGKGSHFGVEVTAVHADMYPGTFLGWYDTVVLIGRIGEGVASIVLAQGNEG
jgi:hypothetical protein